MDATSGVLGDILITAVTSKAYWASKTTELFGVDLRSLALLRVSLAIIVLLDLAYRANDLKAHYTDLGILPRSALMSGAGNEWNISIHNISGLLEIQVALFAIHGLVAVALMAGYRTQVATILVWFFAISLQSRNPMILTGGDNLLALLLFWSMFLPMGARFSVDSALNNGPHRESNRYLSTATAAVLLQVGMVYIFTAIMKSDPIWREDFSAVYYALSIDQLATGLGHYLLNYPDILAVMTAATLWAEFAGPALAFIPFFNGPIRLVVILAFIALHMGIALTLNIGFFPVVSIIGLIVFVPGLFWDTLFSRLAVPSRTGLKIYYDGECNFCWKIVSLMRTFLLVPGVQTYPAQGDTLANEIFQNNNSWVVIDHNGTTHIGFPALIYVLPIVLARGHAPLHPSDTVGREKAIPVNGRTSYGIFSADRFPQIQTAEGGPSRVGTGSGSAVLGVHHLLEHSPRTARKRSPSNLLGRSHVPGLPELGAVCPLPSSR